MSDFLKVEGETDSPIELSRYYEANGFDALAVLSLIAFYSLGLAHSTANKMGEDFSAITMGEEVRKRGQQNRLSRVVNHYFSYLLAYAAWVGGKHGTLPDNKLTLSSSAQALRNLPLDKFSRGGWSQVVAEVIHQYYALASNMEFASSHYLGSFNSEIDLEILSKKIKEGLFGTWTWRDWRWDEQKHAQAMQHINEILIAPRCLYAEEDPITREFWNFALIAVITTETECDWELEELGPRTKWCWVYPLLKRATAELKAIVTTTRFHDGLRR